MWLVQYMIREASAYGAMRAALAPYGVLERVENRLSAGTPDLAYALLGVTGWVELKVDLGSLALEQVLFAERWAAPIGPYAGGLYHLVWRHRRGWAALDAAGARAVYAAHAKQQVAREKALLWTDTTPFPTAAALTLLAPPPRRTSAPPPSASACSSGAPDSAACAQPRARATAPGG